MTFVDILLQLLNAWGSPWTNSRFSGSKGFQINNIFILLNPRSVVKLWGCHPIWITTKYHIGLARWRESVRLCTALQVAMFNKSHHQLCVKSIKHRYKCLSWQFLWKKHLRWFGEDWIPVLEKKFLNENQETWYRAETQSTNLNKQKKVIKIKRSMRSAIVLCQSAFFFDLDKILFWVHGRNTEVVFPQLDNGFEHEKKLNEHWKVNFSENGFLTIIGYLDS